MRLIYSVLFYALIPLVLARMAWRGRREPAYCHRWLERFGFYGQADVVQDVIWIHAVSVGESEAAFPLIRALRRRFPETPFLVTTTTPTGSARVKAVLDPLAWPEACGIMRSFWGEHGMNQRREPASCLAWKHGWYVLTDSAAGWADSAVRSPDSAAGWADSAVRSPG